MTYILYLFCWPTCWAEMRTHNVHNVHNVHNATLILFTRLQRSKTGSVTTNAMTNGHWPSWSQGFKTIQTIHTCWSRLFCYICSHMICCNHHRTPPRSKTGRSIIDWISSLLLSIKGSGHPEVINMTLVINLKWNEALVFLVWFLCICPCMLVHCVVFSTIVSIVGNHRSKISEVLVRQR